MYRVLREWIRGDLGRVDFVVMEALVVGLGELGDEEVRKEAWRLRGVWREDAAARTVVVRGVQRKVGSGSGTSSWRHWRFLIRCLGEVVGGVEGGKERKEMWKVWVDGAVGAVEAGVKVSMVSRDLAGSVGWLWGEAVGFLNRVEIGVPGRSRMEALVVVGAMCRSVKGKGGEDADVLVKMATALVMKLSVDQVIEATGLMFWAARSSKDFEGYAVPVLERSILREKSAVVENTARFLRQWKNVKMDSAVDRVWIPILAAALSLVDTSGTEKTILEIIDTMMERLDIGGDVFRRVSGCILEVWSSKTISLKTRRAGGACLERLVNSSLLAEEDLKWLGDELETFSIQRAKDSEETKSVIIETLLHVAAVTGLSWVGLDEAIEATFSGKRTEKARKALVGDIARRFWLEPTRTKVPEPVERRAVKWISEPSFKSEEFGMGIVVACALSVSSPDDCLFSASVIAHVRKTLSNLGPIIDDVSSILAMASSSLLVFAHTMRLGSSELLDAAARVFVSAILLNDKNLGCLERVVPTLKEESLLAFLTALENFMDTSAEKVHGTPPTSP